MPRKQPPSIVRTVYQVRWHAFTKGGSEKSETFYKEQAARDRFDELSRTGARVRLFQTLRTVKLTMVDETPFDAGARAAHLESVRDGRRERSARHWEARKGRQDLDD